MTDERPCCAARQAAPVRAEVSMLNMEALKAQIAQLRVQLAACLLAAEGGAEADADVARAGAQSPAFDAVRRLRARAEKAEQERDAAHAALAALPEPLAWESIPRPLPEGVAAGSYWRRNPRGVYQVWVNAETIAHWRERGQISGYLWIGPVLLPPVPPEGGEGETR